MDNLLERLLRNTYFVVGILNASYAVISIATKQYTNSLFQILFSWLFIYTYLKFILNSQELKAKKGVINSLNFMLSIVCNTVACLSFQQHHVLIGGIFVTVGLGFSIFFFHSVLGENIKKHKVYSFFMVVAFILLNVSQGILSIITINMLKIPMERWILLIIVFVFAIGVLVFIYMIEKIIKLKIRQNEMSEE